MTFLLMLLGLGAVFEFSLHIGPIWRFRVVLAYLATICTSIASGGLVGLYPGSLALLFLLVSAYRVFSVIRIVEGRAHERYMKQSSLRSSLALAAVQLVVAGVWSATVYEWLTVHGLLLAVASLTVALALVLTISVASSRRSMRVLTKQEGHADRDLPTVTVAIPARNETDDLEACIRSLLASDYPKLEILALDDCSQQVHTPEIIRSFAHDGVRFLAGEVPKGNWLAKNQAYEQLLQASSGELVLFCGVDLRFETGSVRSLVETILAGRSKMISVMPVNTSSATLIQPMRYVWELALPRRLLKRAPVLSSCWVAERSALLKAGGFAAVTRQIVPEAHFAHLFSIERQYQFLASRFGLGITSEKRHDEQRATAIRTRYPQLHRRPELVLLATLAELSLLLTPLFSLVFGLLRQNYGLVALGVVLVGTLAWAYWQVLALAYARPSLLQVLSLPVAVAGDVVLLQYSMWKYEFSEVVWKGRNVCIPVMHVYPHLPKA